MDTLTATGRRTARLTGAPGLGMATCNQQLLLHDPNPKLAVGEEEEGEEGDKQYDDHYKPAATHNCC